MEIITKSRIIGSGGAKNVVLTDRFGNTLPSTTIANNASIDLRTLNPYDWADIYLSRLLNPPTGAQETAVIQFFTDITDAGIFQKAVSIPLIIGGSAADHSWNARYPFDNRKSSRLEFIGSPTHSSTGIVTNGTTSGAFVIAAGSLLEFKNKQVSCYVRVANNGALNNSVAFGMGVGNGGIKMIPNTIGINPQLVAEGGSLTVAVPKNGFFTLQSNGTVLEGQFYRNGIYLGTASNSSIDMQSGCGFGTQSVVIDRPAPLDFSYAYIGAVLTSAQELDHYNIVQTLQTALSRQV
jgi:hypothetical protein